MFYKKSFLCIIIIILSPISLLVMSSGRGKGKETAPSYTEGRTSTDSERGTPNDDAGGQTANSNQRIESLRNEKGLKPKQIRNLTGMPESTLSWYRAKNKIGRKFNRFTTSEEKKIIHDMVDDEKNISQIWRKLGEVKRTTIHNIISKYKNTNKYKEKTRIRKQQGTSSQVAPSVTPRSPDPTTAQVPTPYPVPQTPGTPSTYSMSALFDAASPSQVENELVGAPSTYELGPLPPSVHLSPTQFQTRAQLAVDPFGHLDLGTTIDYAEQASSRRNLLLKERDRLIHSMRPITEVGEYSSRLQQIENLDQQINSTNVIIESLIARAEQLSHHAGPSYRQNIASQSSQQNQQFPSGQNTQTMPLNQVNQSQLYNLASRHGNHYSGPSAAVSFHSGMPNLAGGLVPPSNIVGSPSGQWRNADPSGITLGTQASVGQQSFNFQLPSNPDYDAREMEEI